MQKVNIFIDKDIINQLEQLEEITRIKKYDLLRIGLDYFVNGGNKYEMIKNFKGYFKKD